MFPLSLKKNIRELDRQISLLETECEHLESEKREANMSEKVTSKAMIEEMLNKPFVTGPCASNNMPPSPVVPKIYSASCAQFRSICEHFPEPKTLEANKCCCKNSKFIKKPDKFTDFSEGKLLLSSECTQTVINSEMQQKQNILNNKETRKFCERSIKSIKEVSESSEENTFVRNSTYLNAKNSLIETSEELTSDLLKDQISTEESTHEKISTKPGSRKQSVKPKSSSDEERSKSMHSGEGENKSFGEKWSSEYESPMIHRKKISTKRRLRSARTKKNQTNEIFFDVNITKVLQEKETQCMLENEEKEKSDVFNNLCDSLRTLYALTGEAQMKSSREKINDVLNDMKNNIFRISKINLLAQEKNPLNTIACMKEKKFEDEELAHLQRTLYRVTKYCQELANEKSALSEELLVKTRSLANFKIKEKEYLHLISSLKINLKKMKQEAENEAFAKRDAEILRTKLQEETKVIEALRKSHEKMQELIENYVLENDRLKSKVKISKLETEKFHLLLAGKEEEIKKYKKDIESFQRQITEQLSLLRSKATENEVVNALKVISDQTNSLQTELDSNPSETTVEKENFKTLVIKSFETTSVSSMESKKKNSTTKREETPKKSTSNCDVSKEEKDPKEIPTCPTCQGRDSDSETKSGRERGLQRVLSSSKNLRSSINELLEDIRRETSDKHWSNAPCEATSLSTLITTSSEGPLRKFIQFQKFK